MTDYELGYQDGKEAGYEQREKELIYCKDCAYLAHNNSCWATEISNINADADFCSFAMRKDDVIAYSL